MAKVEIKMGEIGGGGNMTFNSAESISAAYNSWTNTSVPVADITAKSKVIVTLSYTSVFLTACWSIENGIATLDFEPSSYANNLQIDLTSTYLQVKQIWNTSSYVVSVVTYTG